MNASEANQQTIKAFETPKTYVELVKLVDNYIARAVGNGNFSTTFTFTYREAPAAEAVKDYLTTAGYEATYEPDSRKLSVSWRA